MRRGTLAIQLLALAGNGINAVVALMGENWIGLALASSVATLCLFTIYVHYKVVQTANKIERLRNM